MTRWCYFLLLTMALPQSVRGQYAVFTKRAPCYEAPSHASTQIARLGRGDLVTTADSAGHQGVPHVPHFYMHVSVSGQGDCYVSGRHLMPFDSEAPERLLAAIVAHAKRDDWWVLDFRDWFAIHRFFLNELHGVRIQGSPRMELLQLEVLERTARTISTDSTVQPLEQEWLDRFEPVVYSFEPGGFHSVRIEHYWAVHDKYAAHASADSIAWMAALQPVLPNCAGGIRCFLEAHALHRLEYLKRHPAGLYVPGALNRLTHDLGRAEEFSCPEQDDPALQALFDRFSTTLADVPHALARMVENKMVALSARCLP